MTSADDQSLGVDGEKLAMILRKIVLRLLSKSILSVALIMGDAAGADAVDQQKAAASCNLPAPLVPIRPWMTHPEIAIVLVSLTRTPAMMTRLTWAYCNVSTSAIEIDSWRDLSARDQGAQVARLFDKVSGNGYTPILLEGFVFGSLIPNRIQLLPGEALSVWMNFPAIPMTVDHVDVQIDGAGTFESVPIE